MPTYTAIALENLLEPRVRDSLKKPEPEGPNPENGRSRHLYISPALYATPEQSPIPEYSSHDPPSPSPYVANHKRRGGGHVRIPEMRRGGDETEGSSVEEEEAEKFLNEGVDGVAEEDEGCLDPMSEVASELDAADLSQIQMESRSFVSAQGEFFDAIDEFSSDGSTSNTPSCDHRLESELHASRLNLLEEIEKRKIAEETFLLMHSRWEKIRILMSEAGLTFPAPPAISDGMQLEDQEVDKMSQEVVAAKFVAEAVGRGLARAEAEETASAIIELKDLEILRLRDRLQYYETVNHEMSQRKLVEVARRQQERKSRRRWLWSIMGMAFGIGASLAAYSYISHTSESVSTQECGDSADSSSSIVPLETSCGH
ncbi:uncharacterized protein LOC131014340 [Salvia miltiorrhiza]|uniref:uncharacterized protein LOC131014340 n=1 Tax=Salvia miltiorrhiza TaxID=226208 RepID=UPI0025AC1791|nr:uncharacterized protein LOC131014340 [Salvia miltiorrhiza]